MRKTAAIGMSRSWLGGMALVLAGAAASYGVFSFQLKEQVSRLYEAEAKQLRVTVDTTVNGKQFTPPAFSKGQRFAPSKEEAERTALDSKIGFRFSLPRIERLKTDPEAPDLEFFYDQYGVEEVYSVVTGINGHAEQWFSSFYYNGGTFADAEFQIVDRNDDQKPDKIFLTDRAHGTNLSIERDGSGTLRCWNITAPEARKLYDYAEWRLRDFYSRYGIEERLKTYEPQLIIRELAVHPKE
jgi:hypothetical protein